MAAKIVGWILHSEETCTCGAVATVYVAEGDCYDVVASCGNCVPAGTRDPIAEVLARAVATRTELQS